MSNLIRWEPFRELTAMRNVMDRFMDESFRENPELWTRSGEYMLALDVAEDDDSYTVKASMPGIDPNDVEVTLSDNVLTIKGQIAEEKEEEGKRYHLKERRFGTFSRSLTMPATVNADKVEATQENGVLTLHLPKSEAVKPKKISVKKMIESK